jgi:hypothetical protein
MESIVSSWFEFGVAPEKVVDFLPAVVICVNHFLHLSCEVL